MDYSIIGAGRISKKHIDAAIKNNLHIVGICDLDIEKARIMADYIGNDNAHITHLIGEIAEISDSQIVSISASTDAHFHIAKKLLESKSNISLIIEKPVCLLLTEIDELAILSKKKHSKITIAHQNRFNYSVQRLKKSLLAENFGRLFYGVASIRWNRDENYYAQAEWRGKWETDGGSLMNQSIHNIDLLLWMMNSRVTEVFGYIDNLNHPYNEIEDLGIALLRFENGSYGIIESSMNTYPENFEETLSIFGENGSVVLGGKSVNKIVHWNVKNDPIDDLDDFNEEVDSVYGNGHIALYRDFIEAIIEDRKPAVTLQDGRNAVEVIQAIYKSSIEGQSIKLPLYEINPKK